MTSAVACCLAQVNLVGMHDGTRMQGRQSRAEPHHAEEIYLAGDECSGYQLQLLTMPPAHAQQCLLPTFEVGLVFPIPGPGHGPILLGGAKE